MRATEIPPIPTVDLPSLEAVLSEDERKLCRIAAARLRRGHRPDQVLRLLRERRKWW